MSRQTMHGRKNVINAHQEMREMREEIDSMTDKHEPERRGLYVHCKTCLEMRQKQKLAVFLHESGELEVLCEAHNPAKRVGVWSGLELP